MLGDSVVLACLPVSVKSGDMKVVHSLPGFLEVP